MLLTFKVHELVHPFWSLDRPENARQKDRNISARKGGLAVLEVTFGKLPCAVSGAAQLLACEETIGDDVIDYSAEADAA